MQQPTTQRRIGFGTPKPYILPKHISYSCLHIWRGQIRRRDR